MNITPRRIPGKDRPSATLVEALCDHGAKDNDIVLLSLGTGELTRPIMYEDAKGWGLARWAQPILSVVFDGGSDTVSYQVASLLRGTSGKGSYLRIQAPLHEGNGDMDDASPTNVRVLKLLGKQLISQYDKAIDEMLARLR
jgi:hypothetical protein